MQNNQALLEALGLTNLGDYILIANPAAQRNQKILGIFNTYATEAQITTLVKATKFGWKFGKIVWNPTKNVCAVSLRSGDTAAWVTPDGKLERAPVGKKTAYLEAGWSSAD
jgi:hypothetical protein